MLVIEENKTKEYTTFMEKVGCTVVKNSMVSVQELQKTGKVALEKGDSKAIGHATGQVVLDLVLELTKDMSREEIVRYLTESSAQQMIMVVNANPTYKARIMLLIATNFI